MENKFRIRLEPLILVPELGKWLGLATVVGILSGSASALFLFWLNWATQYREAHLVLIALLPVGGFAIGWLYHQFGRSIEGGNNMIIDEIHEPKAQIPLRMVPLILISTVATHLFGGSGGREGTAVQMGAALADQLSHPLKMDVDRRRILLMSGISAGFASVFGTPIAGAVFGLEVLTIGRMRYDAIFPCLIAAVVGDAITRAWGIHHDVYELPLSAFQSVGVSGILAAIFAGAIFGLVGMAFAKLTHGTTHFFNSKIRYAPLRPVVGGILVAAAVWILGTTRYIGLGVPVIGEAFTQRVAPWDFLMKLVFTSTTLGSGFKGGEVTPLFYIGATLGNTLSLFLPIALPLLAAMGYVAVFAGAANTPLACTIMAIEIFGARVGIYAGVACVASYLFSGHAGIYHTQRLGSHKSQYSQ